MLHQSLLVGLSIVSGERVWLRETRLSRCFSRGVNSATNVFLNSVNVASRVTPDVDALLTCVYTVASLISCYVN